MSKKSYVYLCRGHNKYRIYALDIAQIHSKVISKRPPIPNYESSTADELKNSIQTIETSMEL